MIYTAQVQYKYNLLWIQTTFVISIGKTIVNSSNEWPNSGHKCGPVRMTKSSCRIRDSNSERSKRAMVSSIKICDIFIRECSSTLNVGMAQ